MDRPSRQAGTAPCRHLESAWAERDGRRAAPQQNYPDGERSFGLLRKRHPDPQQIILAHVADPVVFWHGPAVK
jgi:hypothetical protein